MTDPMVKGGDTPDAPDDPPAVRPTSHEALALELAEEWTSPEPAAEPAGP